jgi:ATP-dependent protease ClpP protease subunit
MKTIFFAILIFAVCVSFAAAERNETVFVPYDEGKLSNMTFISGHKAYMYIGGQIGDHDLLLWNDINVLMSKTKIREIDVMINSLGGQVGVGLAMVDTINWAEKNGFVFKAYAKGNVASIAVPIFLAFDNRVASPCTLFMIHRMRVGGGSGFSMTREDMEAEATRMNMTTELYIDVLVKETDIKDREIWNELIDGTNWFGAKTALEWGMIQTIE